MPRGDGQLQGRRAELQWSSMEVGVRRCHAISRCWERSSSKLSPRDRTHGQRDERLDVVTRIDIIEDGEGDGGGLEPVGQVGGVNGRGGRSWPRVESLCI